MRKILLTLCFLIGILSLGTTYAEENEQENSGRNKIDIYPLYDNIDMMTATKFLYGKYNTSLRAVIPQLVGGGEDDQESVQAFNDLVTQFVKTEFNSFKTERIVSRSLQKNLPKSVARNFLNIDYNASIIMSGDTPILSIRFAVESMVAGAAHPRHYHQALNFNGDTNEIIQLAELFNPETDYLGFLSQYIAETLSKHIPNKSWIAQGTAPKAENFQIWNLKPDGLYITFDEDTVAPRIYGTQTVLIPYSVLKDYISADSIIIGCVTHQKRCLQENLLTGGFMDEALNMKKSHQQLPVREQKII